MDTDILIDVALWINVMIFIAAILLEIYYLAYRLKQCSAKIPYRGEHPLVDRSAKVIVVFFTIGITVKMLNLSYLKFYDKANNWMGIPTYLAITVTWTMLYLFVFQMKSVEIKISSQSANE